MMTDFTRENDFQRLLPTIEYMDVNDPSNLSLLASKSRRANAIHGDVFRLYGYDHSIYFQSHSLRDASTNLSPLLINYSKLKANYRLLLLKLRQQKPFLFNNVTCIPYTTSAIKANEILKNLLQQEIFSSRERALLLAGGVGSPGGGGVDGDGLELTEEQIMGKESVNLAKVNNFLLRVRNSFTVLSRSRVRKKKLLTSSVVLEVNYISDLELLPFLFDFLLERKRELKPKVKQRSPEVMNVNNCDLLVQVIGGKNIPLRLDFSNSPALENGTAAFGQSGRFNQSGKFDPSNTLTAGGGANNLNQSQSFGVGPGANNAINRLQLNEFKMKEKRRVQSFIEVKFQDRIIATGTFEGITPMWKESLTMPFMAPKNDYTPLTLDQIRDEVYFTLFDEVYEDDRDRGGKTSSISISLWFSL
jgi:hypothetical protein